jgi:general secretion pathway protein A
MYLSHYGLQERPFTITPNPRFIFLSKNHKEAFAHLLYGVRSHAGFIALTGEVGTGKTTVLRSLLTQLGEDGFRCALILNPCLSAVEILRAINREFGIPSENLSHAALLDELNRFLVRENQEGRTVVLVIDEAQNLDPSVLEQIRLISNLETETDKLIQIILAGQPELGALLERNELRQLAQRITVSYHLEPMDYEDTETYIKHRLIVAGFWGQLLFTSTALRTIFRHSGGIPRLINIICDRALLIGYTDDAKEIGRKQIAETLKELKREKRGRRWKWPAFAALAVAILLAGLIITIHSHRYTPKLLATAVPISTEQTHIIEIVSPSLLDDLATHFTAVSEGDSAAKALNAAIGQENGNTIPPLRGNVVQGLMRAATMRGFKIYQFTGSLNRLALLGRPGILIVSIPGVERPRYVTMMALEKGGVIINPPLAGRTTFTRSELETFWTGKAYIPWRDNLHIPLMEETGISGRHVVRLQNLLARAGFYQQGATGTYDSATIAAVKAFQGNHGIKPDGMVGQETLLLLNNPVDRNSSTMVKAEPSQ